LPQADKGTARDHAGKTAMVSGKSVEQRHAEAAAVTGKWDQADAMLLLESGWTQERIAEKVGKSKSWADYYLRFARFLDSHRGGDNGTEPPRAPIPQNLTERAFREAWKNCFAKESNEIGLV
jgi:hypothetical protein